MLKPRQGPLENWPLPSVPTRKSNLHDNTYQSRFILGAGTDLGLAARFSDFLDRLGQGPQPCKAEFTERTCIVVVHVKLSGEQTVQMGLIVDSVEEVVILTAEVIEPTPDFGARLSTEYILGMAKVKAR